MPSSAGTETHQDLLGPWWHQTPHQRECKTPQHPLGTHQAPRAQQVEKVPGQGWLGWDSPCQPSAYLDKLHITEDVHRVVGCVDVVAAAVKLCGAAPVVIVLPVGGLRAVEPTAA